MFLSSGCNEEGGLEGFLPQVTHLKRAKHRVSLEGSGFDTRGLIEALRR
jgi:hypothetical protein